MLKERNGSEWNGIEWKDRESRRRIEDKEGYWYSGGYHNAC